MGFAFWTHKYDRQEEQGGEMTGEGRGEEEKEGTGRRERERREEALSQNAILC